MNPPDLNKLVGDFSPQPPKKKNLVKSLLACYRQRKRRYRISKDSYLNSVCRLVVSSRCFSRKLFPHRLPVTVAVASKASVSVVRRLLSKSVYGLGSGRRGPRKRTKDHIRGDKRRRGRPKKSDPSVQTLPNGTGAFDLSQEVRSSVGAVDRLFDGIDNFANFMYNARCARRVMDSTEGTANNQNCDGGGTLAAAASKSKNIVVCDKKCGKSDDAVFQMSYSRKKRSRFSLPGHVSSSNVETEKCSYWGGEGSSGATDDRPAISEPCEIDEGLTIVNTECDNPTTGDNHVRSDEAEDLLNKTEGETEKEVADGSNDDGSLPQITIATSVAETAISDGDRMRKKCRNRKISSIDPSSVDDEIEKDDPVAKKIRIGMRNKAQVNFRSSPGLKGKGKPRKGGLCCNFKKNGDAFLEQDWYCLQVNNTGIRLKRDQGKWSPGGAETKKKALKKLKPKAVYLLSRCKPCSVVLVDFMKCLNLVADAQPLGSDLGRPISYLPGWEEASNLCRATDQMPQLFSDSDPYDGSGLWTEQPSELYTSPDYTADSHCVWSLANLDQPQETTSVHIMDTGSPEVVSVDTRTRDRNSCLRLQLPKLKKICDSVVQSSKMAAASEQSARLSSEERSVVDDVLAEECLSQDTSESSAVVLESDFLSAASEISEVVYEGTPPLQGKLSRLEEDTVNYSCRHCIYETTDLASIREHIYIHTDVIPFMCGHCDALFGTDSNARLHSKRDHSDIEPLIIEDSTISPEQHFRIRISSEISQAENSADSAACERSDDDKSVGETTEDSTECDANIEVDCEKEDVLTDVVLLKTSDVLNSCEARDDENSFTADVSDLPSIALSEDTFVMNLESDADDTNQAPECVDSADMEHQFSPCGDCLEHVVPIADKPDLSGNDHSVGQDSPRNNIESLVVKCTIVPPTETHLNSIFILDKYSSSTILEPTQEDDAPEDDGQCQDVDNTESNRTVNEIPTPSSSSPTLPSLSTSSFGEISIVTCSSSFNGKNVSNFLLSPISPVPIVEPLNKAKQFSKQYSCQHCDYVSPDVSDIENHVFIMHPRMKRLVCPVCKMFFCKFKPMMLAHFSSQHRKVKPTFIYEPSYQLLTSNIAGKRGRNSSVLEAGSLGKQGRRKTARKLTKHCNNLLSKSNTGTRNSRTSKAESNISAIEAQLADLENVETDTPIIPNFIIPDSLDVNPSGCESTFLPFEPVSVDVPRTYEENLLHVNLADYVSATGNLEFPQDELPCVYNKVPADFDHSCDQLLFSSCNYIDFETSEGGVLQSTMTAVCFSSAELSSFDDTPVDCNTSVCMLSLDGVEAASPEVSMDEPNSGSLQVECGNPESQEINEDNDDKRCNDSDNDANEPTETETPSFLQEEELTLSNIEPKEILNVVDVEEKGVHEFCGSDDDDSSKKPSVTSKEDVEKSCIWYECSVSATTVNTETDSEVVLHEQEDELAMNSDVSCTSELELRLSDDQNETCDDPYRSSNDAEEPISEDHLETIEDESICERNQDSAAIDSCKNEKNATPDDLSSDNCRDLGARDSTKMPGDQKAACDFSHGSSSDAEEPISEDHLVEAVEDESICERNEDSVAVDIRDELSKDVETLQDEGNVFSVSFEGLENSERSISKEDATSEQSEGRCEIDSLDESDLEHEDVTVDETTLNIPSKEFLEDCCGNDKNAMPDGLSSDDCRDLCALDSAEMPDDQKEMGDDSYQSSNDAAEPISENGLYNIEDEFICERNQDSAAVDTCKNEKSTKPDDLSSDNCRDLCALDSTQVPDDQKNDDSYRSSNDAAEPISENHPETIEDGSICERNQDSAAVDTCKKGRNTTFDDLSSDKCRDLCALDSTKMSDDQNAACDFSDGSSNDAEEPISKNRLETVEDESICERNQDSAVVNDKNAATDNLTSDDCRDLCVFRLAEMPDMCELDSAEMSDLKSTEEIAEELVCKDPVIDEDECELDSLALEIRQNEFAAVEFCHKSPDNIAAARNPEPEKYFHKLYDAFRTEFADSQDGAAGNNRNQDGADVAQSGNCANVEDDWRVDEDWNSDAASLIRATRIPESNLTESSPHSSPCSANSEVCNASSSWNGSKNYIGHNVPESLKDTDDDRTEISPATENVFVNAQNIDDKTDSNSSICITSVNSAFRVCEKDEEIQSLCLPDVTTPAQAVSPLFSKITDGNISENFVKETGVNNGIENENVAIEIDETPTVGLDRSKFYSETDSDVDTVINDLYVEEELENLERAVDDRSTEDDGKIASDISGAECDVCKDSGTVEIGKSAEEDDIGTLPLSVDDDGHERQSNEETAGHRRSDSRENETMEMADESSIGVSGVRESTSERNIDNFSVSPASCTLNSECSHVSSVLEEPESTWSPDESGRPMCSAVETSNTADESAANGVPAEACMCLEVSSTSDDSGVLLSETSTRDERPVQLGTHSVAPEGVADDEILDIETFVEGEMDARNDEAGCIMHETVAQTCKYCPFAADCEARMLQHLQQEHHESASAESVEDVEIYRREMIDKENEPNNNFNQSQALSVDDLRGAQTISARCPSRVEIHVPSDDDDENDVIFVGVENVRVAPVVSDVYPMLSSSRVVSTYATCPSIFRPAPAAACRADAGFSASYSISLGAASDPRSRHELTQNHDSLNFNPGSQSQPHFLGHMSSVCQHHAVDFNRRLLVTKSNRRQSNAGSVAFVTRAIDRPIMSTTLQPEPSYTSCANQRMMPPLATTGSNQDNSDVLSFPLDYRLSQRSSIDGSGSRGQNQYRAVEGPPPLMHISELHRMKQPSAPYERRTSPIHYAHHGAHLPSNPASFSREMLQRPAKNGREKLTRPLVPPPAHSKLPLNQMLFAGANMRPNSRTCIDDPGSSVLDPRPDPYYRYAARGFSASGRGIAQDSDGVANRDGRGRSGAIQDNPNRGNRIPATQVVRDRSRDPLPPPRAHANATFHQSTRSSQRMSSGNSGAAATASAANSCLLCSFQTTDRWSLYNHILTHSLPDRDK